MKERATNLLDEAERQIADLTSTIASANDNALELPCPGREKLGDGSVGAAATHAGDNYQRIAEFARSDSSTRSHRPPKFLRGRHGPSQHGGGGDHGADKISMQALLDRLASSGNAIAVLGGLTEQQLDAIPRASDLRFVDGTRTLEQILTAMLKHQAHQVEAISQAVKQTVPADPPSQSA